MSNHDIGPLLGFIKKKLLYYHSKGNVSKELILDFDKDFIKIIHSFDGNIGEMEERLEHFFCGACLKQFEKTEKVSREELGINLYETDYDLFELVCDKLPLHCNVICEDCYKKLKNE